jgi:hypothetical protein
MLWDEPDLEARVDEAVDKVLMKRFPDRPLDEVRSEHRDLVRDVRQVLSQHLQASATERKLLFEKLMA